MMDIGFDDCGVRAQGVAVFQAGRHRGLHQGFIDDFHSRRWQAVVGTIKGVMLGHRMAQELGELT